MNRYSYNLVIIAIAIGIVGVLHWSPWWLLVFLLALAAR